MPFKIDNTLLATIELHLATPRVAPFLAGEPGIGKTEFVKGLDNPGQTKVFSIDVNTLSDKGDLSAPRLVQNPDAGPADANNGWMQVFFPHQTITQAQAYALENPDETVVILLDEINRTDADVTSSVLTLITSRRAGNIELADNIRFVLTGNLKGNVTALDSASLTRFALYEVEPDAQTFLEVMEAKGVAVHPYIAEALRENPEHIFLKPGEVMAITEEDPDGNLTDSDIFSESQEMVQYTAPRTIEGLNEWLNRADDELLSDMINTEVATEIGGKGRKIPQLHMVLRGQTGDTAFTDVIFGKILNKFNGPAAAPTITRPAAWNKIIAHTQRDDLVAEVHGLDQDQIGPVLTYALTTKAEPRKVQLIIEAICDDERYPAPDSKTQQTLFQRGANSELNTSNLAFFFSKDDKPLVQSLIPYKAVFNIS